MKQAPGTAPICSGGTRWGLEHDEDNPDGVGDDAEHLELRSAMSQSLRDFLSICLWRDGTKFMQ